MNGKYERYSYLTIYNKQQLSLINKGKGQHAQPKTKRGKLCAHTQNQNPKQRKPKKKHVSQAEQKVRMFDLSGRVSQNNS